MRKGRVLLLGIGILVAGVLAYTGEMVAGLFSEPPPLPKLRPTLTTVAPQPASRFHGPVSANVQGGILLHKTTPAYPAAIREADWRPRMIIIQATVDEEGRVENARILYGDPVCDAAAIRAVRRWKYSPTTGRVGTLPGHSGV